MDPIWKRPSALGGRSLVTAFVNSTQLMARKTITKIRPSNTLLSVYYSGEGGKSVLSSRLNGPIVNIDFSWIAHRGPKTTELQCAIQPVSSLTIPFHEASE